VPKAASGLVPDLVAILLVLLGLAERAAVVLDGIQLHVGDERGFAGVSGVILGPLGCLAGETVAGRRNLLSYCVSASARSWGEEGVTYHCRWPCRAEK